MRRKNACALRYTMLYAVVAVPMIAVLLLSGKTLLWGADALYQQYPVLYSAVTAVRRLFSGEGIEMLNLSLGQGMDNLTTLAYYGLTDPFQWLGALFQGRALEIWYHVLIFIYIYLSGLYFMLYVRKIRLIGHDDRAQVIAGLLFAFCGYQTIGVIKNPYYASGSMYLVLMLIAVERIFQDRKWLMMSLMTMLMLIANFYLAYQTTLIVIIYIIIRLIARVRSVGVKRDARDGFILLGSYLLGLMMSGAVLLPVAVNYLSSSRVDALCGYTASLWHYPITYYLKLVMLFCAPYDYAGYWSLQSFCPLALFAVMLLWIRRDRDTYLGQLRAGFIVGLVCLCVPLCGKIFNGMGYVTNRWCYGYAFIICLCAAWAVPKLMDKEYAGRKHLALAALIFAGLMLIYAFIAPKLPMLNGAGNSVAVDGYSKYTKSIAAMAGAAAVILCALVLLRLDRRIRLGSKTAMRMLACCTAACCLAYSIGYALVAATSSEFYTRGIDERVSNETAAAAASIEDEGFYRVDTGANTDNHAQMQGYYGTSYYWSLIPSWVAQHYTGLELSTQRWTFRTEGLSGDSYLSALAAVGYAVRAQGDTAAVLPSDCAYVRSVTQADGDVIDIYEYQDSLPLGYMFDAVMSEDEYNALDPVQKRQTLISCAVLESDDAHLETWAADFEAKELEWQLDGAAGNVLRGKAGDTLTLSFEAEADSEVYLLIEGSEVLSVDDDTELCIYAQSEAGTNRGYFILPGGVFNYNQTGVCLRLGYSETGLKGCTLKFKDDGELSFDSLRVISVPTSYCRDAVGRIRENGLWDAEVERDYVHGSITANRDGIMQIAIPYSAGWTAKVDGEEVELVRCGGMYMGIKLDAGAHEVEISYETPGLRYGICLSIAGFAIAAALCVWTWARRKRVKE